MNRNLLYFNSASFCPFLYAKVDFILHSYLTIAKKMNLFVYDDLKPKRDSFFLLHLVNSLKDSESKMNAQETKQLKRALESTDRWRTRSNSYQAELKRLRTKTKDLELSRQNWHDKAESYKKQLHSSLATLESNQSSDSSDTSDSTSYFF